MYMTRNGRQPGPHAHLAPRTCLAITLALACLTLDTTIEQIRGQIRGVGSHKGGEAIPNPDNFARPATTTYPATPPSGKRGWRRGFLLRGG